jgi:probable F420-dependent oxidoreductase
MIVAQAANDAQLASRGRFSLGLGSQVRAHIERRFSMPWTAPAPRMREFIGAVRAIWRSWETGEKLAFEGEHYSHSLMTPMFSPGPNPHGTPDIWLAAVGPAMTRLAGEAADGFIAHAFTTPAYLERVSLPALAEGRDRGGRERTDVVVTPFVITGSDEAARAASERAVREQIAFYGSTPSYRGVMELHGWEDAADARCEPSRRVGRDGRAHHRRHAVGVRDRLSEPRYRRVAARGRRAFRPPRGPGLRHTGIARDARYSANVTES